MSESTITPCPKNTFEERTVDMKMTAAVVVMDNKVVHCCISIENFFTRHSLHGLYLGPEEIEALQRLLEKVKTAAKTT